MNVKRIIEIDEQIKLLNWERELLVQELIDEWFDTDIVDNKKITLTTRRTPVLWEWFDIDDIRENFPEAIASKERIDMKILQKNPKAFDFLEIKESKFITIKEI